MASSVIIETYSEPVICALQTQFAHALSELTELSHEQEQAYRVLERFIAAPGKGVRGSLAAAAYDAASGEHLSRVGLQLGAALELLHAYILIVDDVMDRSVSRRGQPTVHVQYAQAKQSNSHDANMAAIVTGLLAQHMASGWLASIEAPAAQLLQTQQVVHRMLATAGGGQLDDAQQRIGRVVTQRQIVRMYKAKTGAYTFAGPLECGQTLAGVRQAHATYEAFGLPAGVAFQLQNDQNDVFGKAGGTGNAGNVPDDIREGRYTLYFALACARLAPSERRVLRRILASGCPSVADMAWMRQLFSRPDIATQVKRTVEKYTSQAKHAASAAAHGNEKFAAQLCELVDWACR